MFKNDEFNWNKKIRIVSEEQIEEIERKREKSKNRSGSGKKNAGLHESGLPMSKKMALAYIFDCEDIDELEGYAQLEDRDFIETAIEERIEELEGNDSDND